MDDPALIAISALTSFCLAALLVLTTDRHGRYSMDPTGGVQKFHAEPTPRIGGVGIYLALLLAAQLLPGEAPAHRILTTILVAGAPALFIGLLEDLTKRVGAQTRLLAIMGSGLLACGWSGVALTRVDVPVLDALIAHGPLALLFTSFALAGVANAINIIDGFHGLASGTTTIALLALATIAAQVGDAPLAAVALLLAAAVGGFGLVNFPWGRLFLGDGGAYFAGFSLGWLAVLLPMRNADVSPWASLLLCAYPVIEVVYSIARRSRSQCSPSAADRAHLHSLVALRIVQRRFTHLPKPLQSSAVSVLMWLGAAMPAGMAVALYSHTTALALCMAGSFLLYHCLYHRVSQL